MYLNFKKINVFFWPNSKEHVAWCVFASDHMSLLEPATSFRPKIKRTCWVLVSPTVNFLCCYMVRVVCVLGRRVFGVDMMSHHGHLKAAQQMVLDGTSKWSARICIQGILDPSNKHVLVFSLQYWWHVQMLITLCEIDVVVILLKFALLIGYVLCYKNNKGLCL